MLLALETIILKAKKLTRCTCPEHYVLLRATQREHGIVSNKASTSNVVRLVIRNSISFYVIGRYFPFGFSRNFPGLNDCPVYHSV